MDRTPATRRQVLSVPASALFIGTMPSLIGAGAAEREDRELMEACAELAGLDCALRDAIHSANGLRGAAEIAAEADIDRIADEKSAAMDRVAALRARSLAGLVAKARAVVTFHSFHGAAHDYGDSYPHRRLEWSIFAQLAGVSP